MLYLHGPNARGPETVELKLSSNISLRNIHVGGPETIVLIENPSNISCNSGGLETIKQPVIFLYIIQEVP